MDIVYLLEHERNILYDIVAHPNERSIEKLRELEYVQREILKNSCERMLKTELMEKTS